MPYLDAMKLVLIGGQKRRSEHSQSNQQFIAGYAMLSKYIDTERVIHSIKTTIACLIGVALTKVVSFPTDQWIVISIIVVMCGQLYVGSVFNKAYLRLLGTLVGCLFAIVGILSMTSAQSELIAAITIGLSAFFFSYIATSNDQLMYAGTLGAATTTLIMLSPDPTIAYAIERLTEISIGIMIAMLVSQFVLPIHARTHLRRTQSLCLTYLRDYYNACIIHQDTNAENISSQDLDERIIKLLTKQRQLAKEAGREPLGETFDAQSCVRLLQHEKEILRAIDFMHHAMTQIKESANTPLPIDSVQPFNEAVLSALNILFNVVSEQDASSAQMPTLPIEAMRTTLQQWAMIRPPEIRLYVDGFIFSAETLAYHLRQLAKLSNIAIASSAPAAE